MNKMLVMLGITAVLVACQPNSLEQSTGPKTETPAFDLDYSQSCTDKGEPTIDGNSVFFGSGDQCQAGRVVSTQSYANITEFRATVDLSNLTNDYVNASVYFIQNPNDPQTQPKATADHTGSYCDAGTGADSHPERNCREIDLMETNGNKLFQTTLHLGNGGSSAPERFEYAYAAPALTDSNFNPANMKNSPTVGLHDITSIDMSKPFDIIATFTYDVPGMVMTYEQGSISIVVYDTGDGYGANGSQTPDLSDLVTTMQNGYWIEISFWQGYSPEGPGNSPWWNGSDGWGALCNNTGSYWNIRDIQVTTL
jgi:hypothetical protein